MRALRVVVAALLILGLSASTFAGDLEESVARAAQQQAQPERAKMDKGYLWAGSSLFVAGMTMAVYGFLHTSGGQFVSGEVSKESKTGVGGAGLAIAGLGGAVLFLGSQRAKHAPAITVAPGRFEVSKQLSW